MQSPAPPPTRGTLEVPALSTSRGSCCRPQARVTQSSRRSLNGVIEQMEKFSSSLNELSSRVEASHLTTAQERELGIRQQDKQLRGTVWAVSLLPATSGGRWAGSERPVDCPQHYRRGWAGSSGTRRKSGADSRRSSGRWRPA